MDKTHETMVSRYCVSGNDLSSDLWKMGNEWDKSLLLWESFQTVIQGDTTRNWQTPKLKGQCREPRETKERTTQKENIRDLQRFATECSAEYFSPFVYEETTWGQRNNYSNEERTEPSVLTQGQEECPSHQPDWRTSRFMKHRIEHKEESYIISNK